MHREGLKGLWWWYMPVLTVVDPSARRCQDTSLPSPNWCLHVVKSSRRRIESERDRQISSAVFFSVYRGHSPPPPPPPSPQLLNFYSRCSRFDIVAKINVISMSLPGHVRLSVIRGIYVTWMRGKDWNIFPTFYLLTGTKKTVTAANKKT